MNDSLLAVDNLTKRFGGITAVDQLRFTVSKGEVLGMIGPNGAGKTTCFNLIAGAILPTAGSIRFKDTSLVGLKPHQIARLGIARTFQVMKPLKKLTVFDNVLIAAATRLRHLQEATDKARHILRVLKLDHLAGQKAGTLSVGSQKLLEIGKAMAIDPEMLLLDEPMGGLVPREMEQAVELIRAVNRKGVTVIIIEHNMKAIMALAHRIVVLDHGKKIGDGTPETVCRNEQVIEAYLGGGYHHASADQCFGEIR